MARGNRREAIFHDDDDRRFFLATLSEACDDRLEGACLGADLQDVGEPEGAGVEEDEAVGAQEEGQS